MQKSQTAIFKKFNAQKYQAGIVVAQFNKDITEAMLVSAKKMLASYKVPPKNIKIIRVAGSVEIPVVLKSLAETGKYACLVAIGCVIRGDTTHYDYVCKVVSEGVLRIMLDYTLPVGFGILTVENHDQAVARISVGGSATEAALQAAYETR